MCHARSLSIGLTFVLVLAVSASAQTPAGMAFTYQGRLEDAGAPANGTYDLRFLLYNADVGGSQVGSILIKEDVSVTNGYFTVSLDFGSAAFAGEARWLEIGVRPGASTGAFTPLASRQELTPAPNAIYSQSAQIAASGPWSGLTGVPAGFADEVDNNSGGTVTSITAGTGLTGGTITSYGTIGVSFGTTGTTVATGNHNHFGQSWTGSGIGLYVTSTTGVGLLGSSSSDSGTGVLGEAIATTGQNNGVRGVSDSSDGRGVFGAAFATSGRAGGVLGTSLSSQGSGVSGRAMADWGPTAGVYGQAYSTEGSAILGQASATTGENYGVYGSSASSSGYGIYGLADATSGTNYGVYGRTNSSSGYGVYGAAFGTSSYAGYFSGPVYVTGYLTKAGGGFKIDHPLDPDNKYLYHSFVESPDMMNIYNGNVTTDASGYATVEMPEWFEALNRDFRYQLTVLDESDFVAFVQVKVVRKIANNRFTIRSSAPNTEVSWLVTGIRKDAWAEAHRIPVEQDKNGDEKGTYLHPDVFGQPKEMSLDYKRFPHDIDRPDPLRAIAPPES